MKFKSSRELRKFLTEKFGNEIMKHVKVRCDYNLGIFIIDFDKAVGSYAGWGKRGFILKQGTKLTENEKRFLDFVGNNKFVYEE